MQPIVTTNNELNDNGTSSPSQDVLETLGLVKDFEQTQATFMNIAADENEDNKLKRIKFLLSLHRKWVAYKLEEQRSQSIESSDSSDSNNSLSGSISANSASKKYSESIEYLESVDSTLPSLRDIISLTLGPNYGLNEFLFDHRYAVHHNRTLFGFDDDPNNDTKFLCCDVSSCFINQRSNRNKAVMSKRDDRRRKLFFVRDMAEEPGQAARDTIVDVLLDSLHCFVFHAPRLQTANYLEEEIIGADNSKSDKFDIESLCVDTVAQRVGEVLRGTKSGSSRFRNGRASRFLTTMERGQHHGGYGQCDTYAPVKTPPVETEQDALAVYQSVVFGNDQPLRRSSRSASMIQLQPVSDTPSWIDSVFHALKQAEITGDPEDLLEYTRTFLNDEQMDSDGVLHDLSDLEDSNIISILSQKTDKLDKLDKGVLKRMRKVFRQVSFERGQDLKEYADGQMFFYWSFYRDNEDEWNILYKRPDGKPHREGNKGYMLKDWYIDRKYSDFKEELLSNESPFSQSQYAHILELATQKLKDWQRDPDTPAMVCPDHVWYMWDTMGIRKGDYLSIPHIMALMLYTNFSEHARRFVATFHRNDIYETDKLLKARHSEYYWWGRRLMELIDVFGEVMHFCDIKKFYLGVDADLVFKATQVRMYGPVSTTVDFSVAHSMFFESGLVLDIINTQDNASFFNTCNWSCFPNEDERLFFTPRSRLRMNNIHDVARGLHYQPFVKVMNILAIIFNGFKATYPYERATDLVANLLSKLIDNELKQSFVRKPYTSDIPHYVSCLFHRFLLRREEIILNCFDMAQLRALEIPHFGHLYGFKKLDSIFKTDDLSMYRLSLFFRLCHNLERMVLYIRTLSSSKYRDSITMNYTFLRELTQCITILDEQDNTSFQEFIVVEPREYIDEFIKEYGDMFANMGWTLSRAKFTHYEKHDSVDQALYIRRTVQRVDSVDKALYLNILKTQ